MVTQRRGGGETLNVLYSRSIENKHFQQHISCFRALPEGFNWGELNWLNKVAGSANWLHHSGY